MGKGATRERKEGFLLGGGQNIFTLGEGKGKGFCYVDYLFFQRGMEMVPMIDCFTGAGPENPILVH